MHPLEVKILPHLDVGVGGGFERRHHTVEVRARKKTKRHRSTSQHQDWNLECKDIESRRESQEFEKKADEKQCRV
jgi:hypothetical protein